MIDRELDALIAEKVMGWTPHPTLSGDDKRSVGGPWWRLPATREENMRLLGSEAGPWDNVQPPRYSRELVAAWEVGEKIGGCWGLQYGPAKNRWTANFCPRMGALTSRASDISPARAICLAALLAVGVEVPE